jgi:hypothetical protein
MILSNLNVHSDTKLRALSDDGKSHDKLRVLIMILSNLKVHLDAKRRALSYDGKSHD